MAKADDLAEITRALSTPLGDLIAAVGRGVAEAQHSLDVQTMESFRTIYGSDEAAYAEFRKLGYQPTWYRIPEVSAEIAVALSASGEERLSLQQGGQAKGGEGSKAGRAPGRIKLYATPIDASFSNSYDYNVRASSRVTFKVVAVPPASGAEGLKVVPALAGKTFGDARRLLEQLDIPFELADRFYEPREEKDAVAATEPAQGSLLTEGQAVVLTIEQK